MGKAPLKLLAGVAVALSLAFNAAAQQAGRDTAAGKPARPLWSELSPKQQAVLAPIAGEWENLDATRRKKWVAIADRYPKMSPDEQQRLQNRMQSWVALTPAERRVARENYQSLKQLPQPQRREIRQKWRDQQLQQPEAPAASSATDTNSK